MRRLWILISNRSQVLEPSPQGDFRVVIFKCLVGSLTGPLTRRSLSLARLTRSVETDDDPEPQRHQPRGQRYRNDAPLESCSHFSRFLTFLEVKVILILWTLAPAVAPVFSKSSLEAIVAVIATCCFSWGEKVWATAVTVCNDW